ncbi:MAG: RecX family transcriptional regulator [Prevotellaceae bacterium]|jgi:regulatory protein|nr:RecX family transcriptional regulator [Prevotellaceae bacterium]
MNELNKETEQRALARMMRYCALAEHCRSEVESKLRQTDLSEAAIRRIVQALQAEKYLDDERYCRSFTGDKFRFAGWGKYKIAQALRAKGLPDKLIEHSLDELDETEYMAALRRLLDRKQRDIRATNDYERRAKLIRFAMSRGFSYEDVMRAI